MKAIIQISAISLIVLLLSGCGEPQLDTTNTTTLTESLDKILEDKSEKERIEITKALLNIYLGERQTDITYQNLAKDEEARFIYSEGGVKPKDWVMPGMTASGIKEAILQDVVLKAGEKLNKATAGDLYVLVKPVLLAVDKNELELLQRSLDRRLEVVEKKEAGLEVGKNSIIEQENNIKEIQSLIDNVEITITDLQFPSLSSSRARAEMNFSVTNKGAIPLQELYIIVPWQARDQKHRGHRFNILRSRKGKSAGLEQGQTTKFKKGSFTLGFSPRLNNLKAEEIEVMANVFSIRAKDGGLITEKSLKQLHFFLKADKGGIKTLQNLIAKDEKEILSIKKKIDELKAKISGS